MFKLFNKYAILDSIETDDYEAYRIFAQSAGGYADSRREAERTLLKTYHKAKITPFSIARVGYSMQYYGLWSAAVEGLLISCVRGQGKHSLEYWSELHDFVIMLDAYIPTSADGYGRWTTNPDDRNKVLQCLIEAKRIIRQEVSYRSGAMTEEVSESTLKMVKEIKEACEWLSAEGEENNVS